MITISELLAIDDVTFDGLFLASLPKLEEGTMPWDNVGNPVGVEEKKQALKAVFSSSCGWPNSKVILWTKDDVPIHIASGSIYPETPQYISWNYALYAPDAANSKSWLYEESYITQTRDYLKSTFGIIGYQITCVMGSPLYAYHKTKPNAATFYEVAEEAPVGGIVKITYTYK